MSSEAVKKQILTSVSALNLPLDRLPSDDKILKACAAAKLLRNRILREHARVKESIEALRQKHLYDDADDENGEDGEDFLQSVELNIGSNDRKLAREEFLFMSEMMVIENVVVPLLLAHGMNFSNDLLPQLLKLLMSMLLPVPIHSLDESRQKDFLRRLVERCGTDEFFALLIQCVAPVAEKRSKGSLHRQDVFLLEVVLKIITNLFTGPKERIASAIGAFSRNHGIEFFLVVLNQNYAKSQARKNEEDAKNLRINNVDIVDSDESDEESVEIVAQVGDAHILENFNKNEIKSNVHVDNHEGFSENEQHVQEENKIINLNEEESEEEEEEEYEEEEDEEENEGDEEEIVDERGVILVGEGDENAEKFNARMMELFESDEQLWKWNIHILTAMAAVFRCVNAVELAQLSLVSKIEEKSSFDLMELLQSGKRFRECKKESDHWRFLARSRNGAISSNGLLVRGTPSSRLQGDGGTIGAASLLLPVRSRDPLEKARDIDLRKKGRFVKGVSDDSSAFCALPLPTKIQLAQQSLSFICYGFEPLNMMIWGRLAKMIDSLQSTVEEYSELLVGCKNSEDNMDAPAQFNRAALDWAQSILDYLSISASLLRYTREVARLSKEQKTEVSSASFQQQWKCISCVITLDHIHNGFHLLRTFLSSPDLRKRFGVSGIASYLAELLVTLNHLVDGDIVKDQAVVSAANALASSVLYSEESVAVIFEVVTRSSVKPLPPAKSGILIILVFSVLRLMEKCSFRGRLLFPKRKKNIDMVTHEAEETGDGDIFEALQAENLNLTLLQENDNLSQNNGDKDENEKVFLASPSPLAVQENVQAEKLQSNEQNETSSEHPSFTSSGRAVLSSLSSEREVSLGNYFKRLASAKNMSLILSSLRHWRTNDSDVNIALAYIIQSLVGEGCGNVFYTAPFLIVLRDILMSGEQSHKFLYEVCDQIVYEFFNPSFAKVLDERTAVQLGNYMDVLRGAQSFLGFELALRCTRSLFSFNTTDYSILEEKGMPHLVDSTIIPLMDEVENLNGNVINNSPYMKTVPRKISRRKRQRGEGVQSPLLIDEGELSHIDHHIEDTTVE